MFFTTFLSSPLRSSNNPFDPDAVEVVEFHGAVGAAAEFAVDCQDAGFNGDAFFGEGGEEHGAGAADFLVFFNADEASAGFGECCGMGGQVGAAGHGVVEDDGADAVGFQGFGGLHGQADHAAAGADGDRFLHAGGGVGDDHGLAPFVVRALGFDADGEVFAAAEEEDAVRMVALGAFNLELFDGVSHGPFGFFGGSGQVWHDTGDAAGHGEVHQRLVTGTVGGVLETNVGKGGQNGTLTEGTHAQGQ